MGNRERGTPESRIERVEIRPENACAALAVALLDTLRRCAPFGYNRGCRSVNLEKTRSAGGADAGFCLVIDSRPEVPTARVVGGAAWADMPSYVGRCAGGLAARPVGADPGAPRPAPASTCLRPGPNFNPDQRSSISPGANHDSGGTSRRCSAGLTVRAVQTVARRLSSESQWAVMQRIAPLLGVTAAEMQRTWVRQAQTGAGARDGTTTAENAGSTPVAAGGR